jgi:hypothetical protein
MAAVQQEVSAFASLCKHVRKAIIGSTSFPGSGLIHFERYRILSQRFKVSMRQNDILPQRKLFLERGSSWQTEGINIQVIQSDQINQLAVQFLSELREITDETTYQAWTCVIFNTLQTMVEIFRCPERFKKAQGFFENKLEKPANYDTCGLKKFVLPKELDYETYLAKKR